MTDPTPLATAIRERSHAAHSDSEGSGFMSGLLKGEGSREDYVGLVGQHYFIYRALEAATEKMRNDPVAAPFIDDALTRMPALETDLAHLLGPSWRDQVEPLPATAKYVKRIEEVGDTWPGGYVAHHYTRYLGDLSGGLFIGKAMGRRFGFDGDGVRFYQFDGIADPNAFKDAYREKLNAASFDDDERERVIQEVLDAYQWNTDVFNDLEAARTVTA